MTIGRFTKCAFFAACLVVASTQRMKPQPGPTNTDCQTADGKTVAVGVTLYMDYAALSAMLQNMPFDHSYDEKIQQGGAFVCTIHDKYGYSYLKPIGCTLLDKTIVNVFSTADLAGRKYICGEVRNSHGFLVLYEFEGDAFCTDGETRFEFGEEWLAGEIVRRCQIDSATHLLTVLDDHCRVGRRNFAPDDYQSMFRNTKGENLSCRRTADGHLVVKRHPRLSCVYEDGTLYNHGDIISGRTPLNAPADAYPSEGMLKCYCSWSSCSWTVHGCRYGDDSLVLRETAAVTIDGVAYICIDTSEVLAWQPTKKELAMIPSPTCSQDDAEYNLGDEWTAADVLYTCQLSYDRSSPDLTLAYPRYCVKDASLPAGNGVLIRGQYKQFGNEGWFLCKGNTGQKRILMLLRCSGAENCRQLDQTPFPSL